jgi:hypothetical protein
MLFDYSKSNNLQIEYCIYTQLNESILNTFLSIFFAPSCPSSLRWSALAGQSRSGVVVVLCCTLRAQTSSGLLLPSGTRWEVRISGRNFGKKYVCHNLMSLAPQKKGHSFVFT